jgi:hypothetical protein
MAVTQAVAVDAHGHDLHLREDARTRIQLLRGEIVDFAKVRVVRDTLYAWRSLDSAVVVLAFGTLVLLLMNDHS